jgi:hypothetical protein
LVEDLLDFLCEAEGLVEMVNDILRRKNWSRRKSGAVKVDAEAQVGWTRAIGINEGDL